MSRTTGIAAVALATAAMAGCGGGAKAPDTTAGASSVDGTASPVARTPPAPSVVTNTAPTRVSTPTAAERLKPVPTVGTVKIQPGPFTDKLKIAALQLSDGPRPALSGSLLQRTDVSEVLSLILRADFYDASGNLVGSQQRSFGEVKEFFDRAFRFKLRADRALPGASSAVLSVIDYVPE